MAVMSHFIILIKHFSVTSIFRSTEAYLKTPANQKPILLFIFPPLATLHIWSKSIISSKPIIVTIDKRISTQKTLMSHYVFLLISHFKVVIILNISVYLDGHYVGWIIINNEPV